GGGSPGAGRDSGSGGRGGGSSVPFGLLGWPVRSDQAGWLPRTAGLPMPPPPPPLNRPAGPPLVGVGTPRPAPPRAAPRPPPPSAPAIPEPYPLPEVGAAKALGPLPALAGSRPGAAGAVDGPLSNASGGPNGERGAGVIG